MLNQLLLPKRACDDDDDDDYCNDKRCTQVYLCDLAYCLPDPSDRNDRIVLEHAGRIRREAGFVDRRPVGGMGRCRTLTKWHRGEEFVRVRKEPVVGEGAGTVRVRPVVHTVEPVRLLQQRRFRRVLVRGGKRIVELNFEL